jgi:hypothetical protein
LRPERANLVGISHHGTKLIDRERATMKTNACLSVERPARRRQGHREPNQ